MRAAALRTGWQRQRCGAYQLSCRWRCRRPQSYPQTTNHHVIPCAVQHAGCPLRNGSWHAPAWCAADTGPRFLLSSLHTKTATHFIWLSRERASESRHESGVPCLQRISSQDASRCAAHGMTSDYVVAGPRRCASG